MIENDQRLYMQSYRLPEQMESLRKRMGKLRRRARDISDTAAANRLDLLCDAFDCELTLAKLEAAQRGEENSMGVDHAS